MEATSITLYLGLALNLYCVSFFFGSKLLKNWT